MCLIELKLFHKVVNLNSLQWCILGFLSWFFLFISKALVYLPPPTVVRKRRDCSTRIFWCQTKKFFSVLQLFSPKWLTPSFFNMDLWRHPGRAKMLCMHTKIIHMYTTTFICPAVVGFSHFSLFMIQSSSVLIESHFGYKYECFLLFSLKWILWFRTLVLYFLI